MNGNGGNDSFLTGNEDSVMDGGDGDDILTGLNGNDHLIGGLGNDRLSGGNGSDYLEDGAGDDVLNGGAGNDKIFEGDGSGVDVLVGGTGLDEVWAYDISAGDLFDGGSSRDVLYLTVPGRALSLRMTGTEGIASTGQGDARIRGFEELQVFMDDLADTVVFDGRWTAPVSLDGRGGDDRLVGGSRADVLRGGDGDDTLDGGASGDRMEGGAGNDTYYVDSTSDIVVEEPESGVDRVFSSVNLILGSEIERATLTGTANLKLIGNSGDNVLVGNSGNNVLNGREGNDVIDGGAGYDIVTFADATAPVKVDLVKGRATFGASVQKLVGVEALIGSYSSDVLYGDTSANHIWGGEGDDTLLGGGGGDRLDGGTGLDLVSYVTAGSGVVVDLRAGRASYASGADQLISIEGAIGSAFADTLIGSAAATQLLGGAGDDLLEGGTGSDTLAGGSGVDTVSYAQAGLGVLVNLELTFAQDTIGAGFDTITGVERVIGSAYNDTLHGNAAANVLDGGAGNDTLLGIDAGGADVLIGGDGIDTLNYSAATGGVTVDLGLTGAQNTGGGGVDTLSGVEVVVGTDYADRLTGGAGDDLLAGGEGGDTLTGGAGADVFLLTSISQATTITDFVHGVDRIFFPGSIANLTPGVLPDSMFRIGTSAGDADDFVLYDRSTGELFFDPDGSGHDYDPLRVATLSPDLPISASDFVVI